MFYENFKKLCDLHNTTPTQITEKLGMSKGSVSNWKKGTTPNGDIIVRFAEFFNVTTDCLLLGKDNSDININAATNISAEEQELIDNFRLLQKKEKYKVLGRIETYLEEYDYISELNQIEDDPEYDIKEDNITYLDKYKLSKISDENFKYETELWGDLSAGRGIETIPNRESIKVPVKCDFALRVQGDSMEPLYFDQQIICIKQQPNVEQGQVAAVQVDDYIPTAYLKKVYKEGPNIRLVSINPIYEDKIFPAEQIKILGVVVG